MRIPRFLTVFFASAYTIPTISEKDANSFLVKQRIRREFDEGRMSCNVQMTGRLMENVREEIEEVCEEPEEEAEGVFNIKGTLGRMFDGK
ncbi:unnamed protein product [Oikopleura dioica]|uniref:Uncharacterized protein n=1 Tax=Oikopleura dioica TaxID=34765 RepID=E4XV58_OIKDI|nr:unnamed protein product [Oikopleura dioica]